MRDVIFTQMCCYLYSNMLFYILYIQGCYYSYFDLYYNYSCVTHLRNISVKCMTTLKEKQLINDFHLHSFVVNNIYRLFAITYPMHVIDKMGYLLFTTPIHIWGTSHPTEHMTDVQNDKIEYEHSAWCTMLEECI